jgi:hypothetical protein
MYIKYIFVCHSEIISESQNRTSEDKSSEILNQVQDDLTN